MASQLSSFLKNPSEEPKASFAPISASDARVLILGSLPGDKSLELAQYYGHPQNRFWKILAEILGKALPQSYEDRKAFLLRSQIAVWDVAHTAQRKGSLDTAIFNEVPNELLPFIAQHPHLHTIGFNGQKAEKLYDKYFDRVEGIRYLSLPSTSPANCRIRFDDMCAHWRELMDYCL